MHPRSAAALARTARFAREPLRPILAEYKTLFDVCRRSVGVTAIDQFATIGCLMFHDVVFTPKELSALALVISSETTPRLSELCFYNSRGQGIDDVGLEALIGALRPGQKHTGAAGRLRHVALHGQRLTCDGAEELFKYIAAGELRRLRRLDLSRIIRNGNWRNPQFARRTTDADAPDGLRIFGLGAHVPGVPEEEDHKGAWTIDMPEA